jgi:hypothetical protein
MQNTAICHDDYNGIAMKVDWTQCAVWASIFPIAAALHNLVFRRSMCMLNLIGPDYDASTIITWLDEDPSLPWAIVLTAAMSYAVTKWPAMRLPAILIWFSFLPITLWIWDIPFTGRFICHRFHDGRSPIHSRHLYELSLLIYFACFSTLWFRKRAEHV